MIYYIQNLKIASVYEEQGNTEYNISFTAEF